MAGVLVTRAAAAVTPASLSFLAKHLVGVSCVAVLGVPGREVYYLYMASIVGKRQGNATYYYLVESARVDGKPRIVSQQYLGSAAEVMAKLAGGGPGEPVRVQYRSFGDLAAVWSVLTQIGVAAIIDGVAPRRSDAAVSVGTYIALACANRIVAPCSKLAFADWWATTAGPRWVKTPGQALDHRRFWDAMDLLDTAALRTIETELGRRIVGEYQLDLSALVLDMTNFATFIDTANGKAPIAQRGKAKQKRTDLRLVGLALVITRDGGVPLVSHAYPGDRPDVTQFSDVIDELVARYRQLVQTVESVTVVYDAGQNSAANHEKLEDTGIGFVGSLPPSDHPELLALGRARFHDVDPVRYPGVTCVDTTVTALGVTRRAVLTHSPTLHAKQSRGFDQTLAKAARKLKNLQAVLGRGKTRRSKTAVQQEIDTILKPRWVNQVITVTLTGDATQRVPADLADRRRGPEAIGTTIVRQTDPVHQPRRLAHRRRGGRLPFPVRSRRRIPSTQRPPRGVVLPDAPLDRLENTCPRLLLRARVDHRPADAQASPPGGCGPVRPGTAAPTQRHRGDRAALPRRHQRPPHRTSHDHRDDRRPINSRRPLPHPPVRADPLNPS